MTKNVQGAIGTQKKARNLLENTGGKMISELPLSQPRVNLRNQRKVRKVSDTNNMRYLLWFGSEMSSKGPCVKGLVPSLVLLGCGGGDFKRRAYWEVLGHWEYAP